MLQNDKQSMYAKLAVTLDNLYIEFFGSVLVECDGKSVDNIVTVNKDARLHKQQQFAHVWPWPGMNLIEHTVTWKQCIEMFLAFIGGKAHIHSMLNAIYRVTLDTKQL